MASKTAPQRRLATLTRQLLSTGALLFSWSPEQYVSGDPAVNGRVAVLPDGQVVEAAQEGTPQESVAELDDEDELENEKEDAEDLKEIAQWCYIPAGGDARGPQDMTVFAAHRLCEETTSCAGITASFEGNSFEPQATHMFHFKQSFQCVKHTNWISIPSFRASPQSNVENVPLHWTPPSQETWLAVPGAKLLSEEPPVVQFDNFLSDAEISHILRLAESRFARSTGGMTRHLTSDRTSETAWLNERAHVRDPVLHGIDLRIANLTGILPEGMEHLQVLRYGVGQFYKAHNDFVPEQRHQLCGSRAATFFMYLNDVPAGGHTAFPRLKFSVAPAKGRAVLWWDVDLSRLKQGVDIAKLDPDTRLFHEARPVTQGIKWAANKWLHLSNFVDNYHGGKLL